MGAHHSNPLAQMAARQRPNEQMIRVVKLDEDHAIVPNVLPQLHFDPDKRQVSILLGVHVIKGSAIPEARKEAVVPVATLCTISFDDIVARFTEATKPPTDD